jgi:hypothetical protein
LAQNNKSSDGRNATKERDPTNAWYGVLVSGNAGTINLLNYSFA